MIYRPTKQITFHYFGNEALLLDITNGRTFRLNAVGTLIWQKLDGQTDSAEIVTYLIHKYHLPSEKAHQDFDKYINLLLDNQLIEPVPSEAT